MRPERRAGRLTERAPQRLARATDPGSLHHRQIAPQRFQSPAPALPIRDHHREQSVERRSVMSVERVTEFVDDDIVDEIARCDHQRRVEEDAATLRATAPAAGHPADTDQGRLEAMARKSLGLPRDAARKHGTSARGVPRSADPSYRLAVGSVSLFGARDDEVSTTQCRALHLIVATGLDAKPILAPEIADRLTRDITAWRIDRPKPLEVVKLTDDPLTTGVQKAFDGAATDSAGHSEFDRTRRPDDQSRRAAVATMDRDFDLLGSERYRRRRRCTSAQRIALARSSALAITASIVSIDRPIPSRSLRSKRKSSNSCWARF